MTSIRRPTDDPEYLRELGKIAEAISLCEHNASKAQGAQRRYFAGQANRFRLLGRQLARNWYEREGLLVPAELRDVPRRRS